MAPSVVTMGTFDGVHRGHRLVIDRMVAAAKSRGLRSVVVTFEPHPLVVVKPDAAPPLLTTSDEKLEALDGLGIDEVAVVPFTRDIAALEADQFVDQVLIERFGMRELFAGHDHGFGRGRSGDASTLERLGHARGFNVHVVPAVQGRDGTPVSSSAIRRAVVGADLARAADGLGRPYAISGLVEHGDARGAKLGFRTLNVAMPASGKLLPPDGVYAVRVRTSSGSYGGMLSQGARPTFDDQRRLIEAHLFDASGDWYGQRVHVDFVRRLRDIERFDGAESLIRQLRADEEASRAALKAHLAGL